MRRRLDPGVTLLSLILVLSLGCTTRTGNRQNSEPPQSGTPSNPLPNRESENYAVLSALIKDMYVDDGVKLLVIQNARCPTTTEATEPIDAKVEEMRRQMEEYAFKELPELKHETIDDFHAQTKVCHPLTNELDIPIKYVLVVDKDLEPLFPKGELDRAWRRFYEKYPSSSGIVSFSRPGFNNEMNQAVVSTARSCGGLCGAGYFILLTKDQGRWKVRSKTNTWVS